ncbi:MAG: hypothetical protein ACOYMN_15910 [Roseimicrobium sp.]
MRMRSVVPASLSLAAVLFFVCPHDAMGVIGETGEQYLKRYGSPTHDVEFDPRYECYAFASAYGTLVAAFYQGRSFAEVIVKAGTFTPEDLAAVLKDNGGHQSWTEHKLPWLKPVEKQGAVREMRVWARADARKFVLYQLRVAPQGTARAPIQEMILVANQRGVGLGCEILEGKSGNELVLRPVESAHSATPSQTPAATGETIEVRKAILGE